MKLAKKRFNAFLELDYLKDVAHEDVVDVGPTADVIIKNIAKRDIDIVVMGSTGASPDLLEEVFVGSNTDKIVGGIDVPVLVVKRKMDNFDIKNVVFASNFKDESLDAFKKTKDFADSFGAKLKLLFVNLPSSDFLSSSEIRETMREFLNKTKIPLTQENIIVHNDYSLKEGVLNAAKENKADLIAMTTRGRSGIAYLINGSVADDVVKDSSLPVLTFKF